MGEIIHIQVGHCGNQIGKKFWEVVADEHGITPNGQYKGDTDLQLDRVHVYFREGSAGQYVPRAVLVDMDPGTQETVVSSPFGCLFQPENYVMGKGGAGNNWGHGFFKKGEELAELTLDVVRREAECCDQLQGIQLVHSLGGGTGSGVGSRLLEQLRGEYKDSLDTILTTFSVIPSSRVSDTVVEPYNTILALDNLIDFSDINFFFDNEALYQICHQTLNLPNPTYEDLNYLVAATMSGLTAGLRFPGQLNADLRKLAVNATPLKHLHFFVPGLAPLSAPGTACYRALTVNDLTYQIFDTKNMMVQTPKTGKMYTASVIWRGRISMRDVDEHMSKVQLDCDRKKKKTFVDWIPNNVMSAVCDIPPRGTKTSATLMANTTAIRYPLMRLYCRFHAMFSSTAFTHWYLKAGVTNEQLENADAKVIATLDDYSEAGEGGGSEKGSESIKLSEHGEKSQTTMKTEEETEANDD